jgi:hypothetical protein
VEQELHNSFIPKIQSSMFNVQCNTIMNSEKKKELCRFLWKLLAALLAALGGASAANAAIAFGLI